MWAVVNVVIAVASVFTDLGFGSSLVQNSEVTEEHYNAVFTLSVGMGLLLMGTTILCSGLFSRFYDNESLQPIIIATSPIFIINAVGSVGRAKLYRELNFSALNVSAIYGALFGGVIGILLAIYKFNVWSLVAQLLVNAVTVTSLAFVKARWIPRLKINFTILGELWGYSSRLFVSTLVGTLFGQLDKMVIGKTASSKDLGYYHRARSLEALIQSVLSESALVVLFPSLCSLKSDAQRHFAVVNALFSVTAYIGIYLSGFMYLISYDLIALLFSDKWLSSAEYFKIITIGLFVYPLGALLSAILASRGYSAEFLRLSILKYGSILPAYVLLCITNTTTFLWAYVFLTIIALVISIRYVSKVIEAMSTKFYAPIAHALFICFPLVFVLSHIKLKITTPLTNTAVTFLLYTTAYIAISFILKNQSLITLRKVIGNVFRETRHKQAL